MIVFDGEYNYSFNFKHDVPNRKTKCVVDVYKDDELINKLTGNASCNVHDNFCRATGRKVALTNVLKHFERPSRVKVWNEYKKNFKF